MTLSRPNICFPVTASQANPAADFFKMTRTLLVNHSIVLEECDLNGACRC